MSQSKLTIGIDCGGVCRSLDNDGEIKSIETKEDVFTVPESLDTLIQLKKDGHHLVLISFAGAKRAAYTKHNIVTNYPGVFDRLFFVKDRAHKPLITDFVGADIMIDDRVDILDRFVDRNIHRLHFTGDPVYDAKLYGGTPDAMINCSSWKHTYKIISSLESKNNAPNAAIETCKYCYKNLL